MGRFNDGFIDSGILVSKSQSAVTENRVGFPTRLSGGIGDQLEQALARRDSAAKPVLSWELNNESRRRRASRGSRGVECRAQMNRGEKRGVKHRKAGYKPSRSELDGIDQSPNQFSRIVKVFRNCRSPLVPMNSQSEKRVISTKRLRDMKKQPPLASSNSS